MPPRVMPDAWKRRLKVGDMVDARDRSHNWFEAVVVEVLPGAVKVHFKGWDAKYVSETHRYTFRTLFRGVVEGRVCWIVAAR